MYPVNERKQSLYNEVKTHFGVGSRVVQIWLKEYREKGKVPKQLRTPTGRWIVKNYAEFFPNFEKKLVEELTRKTNPK